MRRPQPDRSRLGKHPPCAANSLQRLDDALIRKQRRYTHGETSVSRCARSAGITFRPSTIPPRLVGPVVRIAVASDAIYPKIPKKLFGVPEKDALSGHLSGQLPARFGC